MEKNEFVKDELILNCLGTWVNKQNGIIITISRDELSIKVNDGPKDIRRIRLNWIEDMVWIDSEYTVISGTKECLKIGKTNFFNTPYEWILDFERIVPFSQ